MKRNRTISMAIMSGLAVFASVPAWSFFTGYSWNGGTGNWSDGTKWTPGGIPSGAGDTATISSGGTYQVNLDGNRSVDSVNISNALATLALGTSTLTLLQPAGLTNSGLISSASGGIVGNVTNNSGANVFLYGGNTLNISSDVFTNNGTINVNQNAAGAGTNLNFLTPCLLTGTGRLQLSQDQTWAQLNSTTNVTLTNDVGHTIGGRGNIHALMVNGGTIAADWSGQNLYLRTQTKSNNGTVKATTGALIIEGIQFIQSVSGNLIGDNGPVALRNGASVFGGTLSSTGAGQILCDSGSVNLSAITNQGTFNMVGGTSVVFLPGNILNNGTFNINSNASGAITSATFTENTVISGTGTIQMSQAGTWAQILADAGKTITNAATHTIKGRGQIGAAMVNNGMVHADWGSAILRLFDQPKTNTGTMKASGGTPALSIDGCAVTQTGAGQIFADGANVLFRNGGSVSGGTFNSVGASNGIYFDQGDFAIQNFTNNGNMAVAGGRTVSVGSGLFVNNGLFNLNYNVSGATTKLDFLESVAITGNGTLQLSQVGTWAEVATALGRTLTNGSGHTIKGRGRITANLVNNGEVRADWGNAELILTGSPKVNNNLFESSNGTSALSIDGCAVTQGASGQIFADEGNVALRNGASIANGTLNSSGSTGIYGDAGSSTLQNLTSTARIFVQGGSTMNLIGSIVNNNVVNLNYNQAGATTKLHAMDDVSLSGTGYVQLSQAGTWADVSAEPGKTVTNGASHTFKGRGQISAPFVNNGTVSADWGSATLELNGGNKTNNNILKSAFSTSALSLKNCQIDQLPTARIIAEAGNVGLRGSAIVNGGRFESNPGFATYVDEGSPAINGSTNAGTINVEGGRTLNIGSNGLVNNGPITINYNSAGATTALAFANSATLSGTGTVQLNQSGTWAQVSVASGQTMTHDVGHTIKGRGLVTGSVLNKGSILADWGSASLTITAAAPGTENQGTIGIVNNTSSITLNAAIQFLNKGMVNVIGGTSMTVNGGDFTQTDGITTVDGTLTVTGGNKTFIGGGTLKGSGIVNGLVQVAGTGEVAPGNSAGKLRVQGAFTQQSPGATTIELGGTTPVVEHDVLEVTGAVSLNGTLKIKIINSFSPNPSMTFTVLTGGSVTGSFANVVVEGGSVDLEPSVVYTGTQVQVTFLNKVQPTSFAITGGFYAGGVLSSLFNSDNDYVYNLCDEDNSTGRIEVTSASPVINPTKLRFAYEAGVVRNDMVEQVEMFNYVTNQWVLIPPTQVGSIADRRLVVVATNPQQYVKTGTLEIKARVTWIPSNDTNAFDGWTTRIDQCAWFIGP